MGQEVELKLSLPPSLLPALRRHPLFQAARRAATTATLINTYYDTPAQDLANARIALRTRKRGRSWVQTVKSQSDSSGGLSSRPEWEYPYLGAFDFAAVGDVRTRSVLERHADALTPLFTTNFRRETRRLTRGEGVSVLLMVDRGSIVADGREEPLCEIELELESGCAADLFELAIELAETLPVRPENASKAERGLRLFRNQPLVAVKAAPSPISRDDSPLAAFSKIAHSCLAQWQANAAGAADSEAPEFVHQMRVALRRLRSALGLFAPALPDGWAARWSQEFAAAADELGEARDIDVLHEELLAPILADDRCPANVRGLARKVIGARDRARKHVRRNLSAQGQGLRVLRFARDLEALQSNPLDASADLSTYAGMQLDRLRKRARKRWLAAAHGSPEGLHYLRISLKRLRYGVEFFDPLCAKTPLLDFVGKLARAQESLGYLNDLAVAAGRLHGWAGKNAQLHAAVAFVMGWHGPRSQRLRARILPAVEKLLWATPPWRGNGKQGR